MRFESPAWLALLTLIPLLAILFVAGERQGARNLKRFAAARLLPVLGRSAKWPRIVRLILIMVAIAFLSLALARPSYGYHLREIHGKGADVIFAVDVSRSMLCTDISPDRLTRAKLAAKDLMETARGHRIGVIPFSREAFLQCPLTLDESAVSLSLDALNTSSVPKPGTSIAGPIAEARNAFADSGKNKRILVIFTDGEDLEGAGLQEARATKDMTIITVGTGTVQGAPVPQSAATGSGYIRDDSGTLVTSKLDASNLESLSEATGGFYAPVNSPMLTFNFKSAINKDETESNVEAANIRVPIIRYRWPLAAALVLLIAEAFIPAFRRKGGAVLAILAMLLPAAPNPSDAAETTANPATQAAPANKKPLVPAGNPRESYNKGVELYKKGQYEEAYAAFQKAANDSAASPDDLRKQIYGNAGASKLAQALSLIPAGEEPMDPKDTEAARGLLNRAKSDLEKALSIAPDDAILQHNFKLVNDAFAELGKHKPKPPTKEDKPKKKPEDDLPKPKKPDPLPTPKHKEEPPPPKKDDKDNKDNKGNKGDQGDNGGKDKDSKGGGQDQSGKEGGQSGSSGQNQGQSGQQDQPQGGQNQPQQNQPQQQPQQQGQQPKPQQGQQQQQSQGGQQNQSQPQQGAGQDKQPQPQSQQPQKPEQPKSSEEKKDSGKDKGNQPKAGNEQQAQPQGASDNQSPKEQNAPQPGAEKKQPNTGEGENGKEKKAQPQQQPQPASAGNEEKRETPKPQPQPASAGNEAKREAQQPQPQQEKSLNQPQQAQAATATGGDQSPESKKAQAAAASAEEPRREGEHTANLARPDMKPEDKKPGQTQVAKVAQARDGKGDKQGEAVGEGGMTPVQAEQLLKILQNDENLLPSGQAKDQPLNNTSGRDW